MQQMVLSCCTWNGWKYLDEIILFRKYFSRGVVLIKLCLDLGDREKWLHILLQCRAWELTGQQELRENAEVEFRWMYPNFVYQAGFFGSSFYWFVLLKQFHFVEEKYSLALRKLGSSHCLVEAVMFMQCEEAPAGEMVACPVACLEDTCWKVNLDLQSLTLSQLIAPHHWGTHSFLSERISDSLFLF